MPLAKENRRKKEVSSFMVSRSTGNQFKWLSPVEKDKVWRAFMPWVDEAAKRGASVPFPDNAGLSEQEADALYCMCRDAQEGIDSYWAKYSHTGDEQPTPVRRTTDERSSLYRRTADEQPTNDRRTSDEQPKEEIKEEKEEIKEQSKEREKPPAHTDAFVPPSVDEVRRYAAANNLRDDAEKFVEYYNARDWKYKDGTPLKRWEAAYRLWLMREKDFQNGNLKTVSAQNYQQRDYSEPSLEETLGVTDLFK